MARIFDDISLGTQNPDFDSTALGMYVGYVEFTHEDRCGNTEFWQSLQRDGIEFGISNRDE